VPRPFLKEQLMRRAGLQQNTFFSQALWAGLACAVGVLHASAFANPPTATSNSTATAMSSATTPAAPASLSQDELQKWCDPVTRVLPKIKLKPCMKAGLASSGAKSVKGLPILSREIAARGAAGGKSAAPIRVMVIGGIHGDELTSSAIVFRWLELVDQPEAHDYRWQIVPLLNPDGALTKPATRVNANGVDLNRNFPTPNWEKEARHYWVVKTASDPRRFPGKAPISEPESRWLHNEIIRFKPDVIISVHAPFGVLDFDGPIDPPYKLGALTLMPVGIYPGSLGNYGGVHKGVPVVTIELPHALDLPSDAEIKNIWRDMLAWIDSNIAKGKTEVAQRAVKGLR
jgi:murein peptide amidase A